MLYFTQEHYNNITYLVVGKTGWLPVSFLKILKNQNMSVGWDSAQPSQAASVILVFEDYTKTYSSVSFLPYIAVSASSEASFNIR